MLTSTPAIQKRGSRTKLPSVILNAVKNLVLYAGVPLFLKASSAQEKGAIWVLEDEILHCVQNDRGGQGADFPLSISR
jgi:hypothetical protein